MFLITCGKKATSLLRSRLTRGSDLRTERSLRPEIARRGALRRAEGAVEGGEAFKAAGKGNIGDRPLRRGYQKPAARFEAKRGHGLGKALFGGFKQLVQVTDRNAQSISDEGWRQVRVRQVMGDKSLRG
jgi:hypothetical protein